MIRIGLRKWLFLTVILSTSLGAVGQDLRYTTHTDIGVLTYTSPFFQGMTFTGKTFHGLEYQRNWQLGLSAGVDKYTSFWVLPLSAGARYTLLPDAVSSLYAGMDIGHGFPWLNKKIREEQSFSGGFFLQPTIGVRIGKKDKVAFTISASYQRQDFASRMQIRTSRIDDEYTFHRIALRFGLMF